VTPNQRPVLSYTTPDTLDKYVSTHILSPNVTGTVTQYSITPALPRPSIDPATGVI